MGVEGWGWGGLGGLTVTSTVTPIDPVSALRLCCGSVAQEGGENVHLRSCSGMRCIVIVIILSCILENNAGFFFSLKFKN